MKRVRRFGVLLLLLSALASPSFAIVRPINKDGDPTPPQQSQTQQGQSGTSILGSILSELLLMIVRPIN